MFIALKSKNVLLRSEERKSIWVVGLICRSLLRTEKVVGIGIRGYRHFTPSGVKSGPTQTLGNGLLCSADELFEPMIGVQSFQNADRPARK